MHRKDRGFSSLDVLALSFGTMIGWGWIMLSGQWAEKAGMLGAYLRKDKAEIKEDIEDVVRLFPRLGERIKQYAGTLSGGEQQMVAVGRALMARPKLLCLDEPSLGLAPNIQDEMFDKLNELNKKRNQTILLVEQNAYIALEYADRAYVIDVGRIIREGTGQELLNDTFIQKSYLGVDAE